ncbi:MAG: TatD family hydrolase [Acidimicrobiia bacterium]|nr:TatD family hydrolase [Acidimicrobiia bacterium]
MATWVDSHCHLFSLDEDPGSVLDRAQAAGVKWVIVPGIDLDTSLAARAIASAEPARAIWSAGLHPHDAAKWLVEGGRIEALAAEAAAIGECGLDFYRNLAPRQAQLDAFRAQLALAADLEKPVIIHCRDAFADVYAELEAAQLGQGAVLHCWTGGPKWTKRFRELGVTFSYAGPVTFEGGDTVRLGAAHAPLDRTMVETDTPYLTPPPDRRALNEPANVPRIGQALAEVWGVEVAAVAASSTATATRVFGGPSE